MRDEGFMAQAMLLAERGRGRTSPNPMVGALLVDREGVIVGRGFHEYAGGPHAEVRALEDAGERARGAVLYCTLEPCSHTGRTGPCAPHVVSAGIARAVVAGADPNPLVAGQGLSFLRGHGVAVTLGVLGAEAERLNAAFFMRMRRHRPFVTVKVALSADYCTSQVPGKPTRLTGAAANRLIHRERAEIDALAVGSGTVLADDPRLTPRVAYRHRPLTRVVFDSRLRIPPSARLLSTLGTGPVIIVTTPATAVAARARVEALIAAGASVLTTGGLGETLERLAGGGVNSLLVEGGTALHQGFWDAGLVDRLEIFITPRQLGPGGMAWLPFSRLATRALADVTARTTGEDILIEAYVHRPD